MSIILLAAAFVRFVGLDKSPASLGYDEAALGYNAYSLLKTGKDEYGNLLPLSLRSFNDFKPALYSYLTIPFIYFGELNDSAVRMVSAVVGVVSLVFLFLFLKTFIRNKNLLLLTFAILSFQPWRIHFSRTAFEANLSAAFFIAGCWFLINTKSKIKVFWSTVFFALSIYSYHSARLSAPMFLVFWALDPIKLVLKKNLLKELSKYINKNYQKVLPLVGLVILCVPILLANTGGNVLTRFKQENVFSRFYPYAPNEITNPISSLYYLGGIISGHIFSYVSPINLNERIFKWVEMSPMFIVGMGMLGWLEGIFFIFGFLYLIKRILRSFNLRFLIYWIVAGIAPAAATWNWYHPLRSLNIYPALEIIVALGVYQVFRSINSIVESPNVKKGLLVGFVTIIAVSIIYTINNELLYSSYENNGTYQPGGYKEGMPYLESIQDKYDQIIIDSPHAQSYIFLLFYQQFDPTTFQSFSYLRPKPGVCGNLNFNFDKYIFRKVDWPVDKNLRNVAFWTSSDVHVSEIEMIPGAKIKKIKNVLYDTASIITIE
ncbi:MAG: hypothetical protein WC841_01515 [Candidatus Shapirobacteria bacterium]